MAENLSGSTRRSGRARRPVAAAWRVHLLAEHEVGGTGGEAKAAVDALLHGIGHSRALRAELVNRNGVLHCGTVANFPAGSSAAFTRRAKASPVRWPSNGLPGGP